MEIKVRKNQSESEANRALYPYEVISDGERVGTVKRRNDGLWTGYDRGGYRITGTARTRQQAAEDVAMRARLVAEAKTRSNR